MRVLVTGGAGRLGRSVVDGLADAGHEVVSVDVVAVPPGRAAATFPADLTDLGQAYGVVARYRPEAVVHLAAIAVPFSRPESVIHATNTALAYNVLTSAVDLGVGTVVTASSPTVMGYGSPAGWSPAYLPLDEDHPPRPWNAYGLSKLAAEQTVQMLAAQHGDRVRLAAFRPCFVIAPEEWDGAPTQQGHTVRERIADPRHGAVALFNYVDARDAADFLDTLLRRAGEIPNGEVFFVGAQDALAEAPLAELLPRYSGVAPELAAGLTGTAPAFSTAKAEKLLGWTASRSWRTELS
ncbi:nucleoside-diphosphate-sugar epimerase [Geodermatophilus bullaregiensis]|uniref:NAD-dependent epimerase/dehydratase family protein n=1 Tax=Geodermatophilus bullaregiensis TaxID=1564160 RepID=UPI00195D4413|nr:NAD(P)-dependent oxidoreductase [Geodermatophilus bullaregiensis]MBM7807921.1 nucleoside-diphosphate-sugar epimerase [Geodermatophilus bullaregiensis]